MTRTFVFNLVLIGAACGAAGGQPLSAARLQRVEAGRADTGPLAISTRELPEDLRVPTGFEHVYQASGDSDSLVRISGALVAEFPRSQYNLTRWGPVPVVPAGTVFHIGMPSDWAWGGAELNRPVVAAFNAIDRRVPPTPAPASEDPDRLVDRSIWQSEVYRSIRVRELLRDAAADGELEHMGSESDR
jgi:hypothetical protein